MLYLGFKKQFIIAKILVRSIGHEKTVAPRLAELTAAAELALTRLVLAQERITGRSVILQLRHFLFL